MALLVEIEKLKPHKFALLAPPARPEEFAALVADIARKGIREPLVVIENGDGGYLIVDGIHRHRAATELGLKKVPVSIRKMTDEEVFDYVLSSAVCRRSLTPDQKAALSVRIMPEKPLPVEIREAAMRFGTTESLIKKVLKLKEKSEELFERVLSGELSVAAAFDVLEIPETREIHPEVEKLSLPSSLKERLSVLPPDLQLFIAREMEKVYEGIPEVRVVSEPERAESLSRLEAEISALLEKEKLLREVAKRNERERRSLERLTRKLYLALKQAAGKTTRIEEKNYPVSSETVTEGLTKTSKLLREVAELKEGLSVEEADVARDPEFIEGSLRLERALRMMLLSFEERALNEVFIGFKRGFVSEEAERLLFTLLDSIESFLGSVRSIALTHAVSGTRRKRGKRFLLLKRDEPSERN